MNEKKYDIFVSNITRNFAFKPILTGMLNKYAVYQL